MALILRSEKGSKLTAEEMDNNLIYLESNGGGGTTVITITNSHNGMTLSAIDSIIFVDLITFSDIILPDPSTAIGKKITFIKKDLGYESGINVYGNFYDGNTFTSIYQPGLGFTVTTDGNVWYFTSWFEGFPSDIRFKTDISKIGVSPSGINIYSFRYKSNPSILYQGVLANEVESFEMDGYLYVNYEKIDVEFKQI